MAPSTDQIHKAAKQQLESELLLGVDFVPRLNPSEIETEADEPTMSTVKDTQQSESGEVYVKERKLEELQREHDANCPHCTVATAHTQTVFGEGHPDADLMFIGEAPGAEEDRTGRPFVGRAGQKLEDILKAMKMSREEVYIANVLKSRPPDNRTPLQHEIDGCSPYLAEQIRIIQPKVIVTLGGPASKRILDTNIGITRLRGQWQEYIDEDLTHSLQIPVMPTFHPAYLLRNYTRQTREQMWSDMQLVLEELGRG